MRTSSSSPISAEARSDPIFSPSPTSTPCRRPSPPLQPESSSHPSLHHQRLLHPTTTIAKSTHHHIRPPTSLPTSHHSRRPHLIAADPISDRRPPLHPPSRARTPRSTAAPALDQNPTNSPAIPPPLRQPPAKIPPPVPTTTTIKLPISSPTTSTAQPFFQPSPSPRSPTAIKLRPNNHHQSQAHLLPSRPEIIPPRHNPTPTPIAASVNHPTTTRVVDNTPGQTNIRSEPPRSDEFLGGRSSELLHRP